MAGIGAIIWKLAVALYLLATGVLGTFFKRGDLASIINHVLKGDIFIVIAGVIALLAGLFLLLEMFNIKISILDTLILIVAIIWAVFVIILFIQWIGSGFSLFWDSLQRLGVYIMVLASLLIASKKFG